MYPENISDHFQNLNNSSLVYSLRSTHNFLTYPASKQKINKPRRKQSK